MSSMSSVSSSSTLAAEFNETDPYADINDNFSPIEISDIRGAWAKMKDDPSAQEKTAVHGTATAFFCQQFYENLLGEYPNLQVLFPSIKSQSSLMAGILSLVISQLDNLPRVRDVLISLGKRHSRIIGVEVGHYELVGNALIRTLADRCLDSWTVEIENAWIKFYSYIANIMLQASEDPPIPSQILYPSLTMSTSSLLIDSSKVKQQSGHSHSPSVGADSGTKKMSHFKSRVMSKKKRGKDQECVVM